MSRSILIRELPKDEAKKLDAYKKDFFIKTDSKAVLHMINKNADLNLIIEKIEKENALLKHHLSKADKILELLKSGFTLLNDLKS